MSVGSYCYNNNKKIRLTATFLMAFLVVLLFLFNIKERHSYEIRVKGLEDKISNLDEELFIAQQEILYFLENTDLKKTLEMFNKSQEELGEIVHKIDELTEQLGD